jgi:hypothetical protein
MKRIINWKMPCYLALTAGIIGFSGYGVYHTAHAYDDITQSPAGGTVLSSDAAYDKGSIVPGGSLCNPLGCAACNACAYTQYQQNVEPVRDPIGLSEHVIN